MFYKYVALNNDGKKIKSSEYCENEAELIINIRKRGYYVKKLKLVRTINLNNLLIRVSIKDIAIFAKQLSSMLNAGFTISEALTIIHEQIDNKLLKNNIKGIEAEVKKGSSFYESIAKYENNFPGFFIQMINIGEQSGNLDVVLKSMYDYYMKEYKIKRKLKSAMIYPAFLLSTTVFILLYLEINIIPLFSDTFTSLGTELPMYSKCLMLMSNSIRNNLYIILLMIILFIVGVIIVFKSDKLKYRRDRFSILIPIIGTFRKKVIGAKFSSCLCMLQKSGVNIIYALQMGSKVINNIYVEKEIENVLNSIKNGDSVAGTLEMVGVFPKFMISMIALGEQSGNLDEMLDMASSIYEEDIEDTLNKAISMLEPIMIIILALLVGTVIMAIMVPMIKMMQAV